MNIPDGIVFSVNGKKLKKSEINFFQETNPFGFILFKRNFSNKRQITNLIKDLKCSTKNPNVLIFIDQEGGRVQRLNNEEFLKYSPQKSFGDLYQIDKSKALRLSYYSSYLMGCELSEIGVNVNFSPVCDIFFDFAHNVIGDRSFSSDPNVVLDLSIEFCKGLTDSGLIPVPKHFPGHGRSTTDTHKNVSIVDIAPNNLINSDLVPFRILKDLSLVMLAHIIYSKIDEKVSTYSKKIIKEFLRKKFKFNGIILSDDISMEALSGKLKERVIKSYKGGCDIILYCKGKLDEMEVIQEFVKKIKKKHYDYFINYVYGIKKKELDVKKIKEELINNQLVTL